MTATSTNTAIVVTTKTTSAIVNSWMWWSRDLTRTENPGASRVSAPLNGPHTATPATLTHLLRRPRPGPRHVPSAGPADRVCRRHPGKLLTATDRDRGRHRGGEGATGGGTGDTAAVVALAADRSSRSRRRRGIRRGDPGRDALLSLPLAAEDGSVTGFVTALFTSTSAVCVTGLAVVDTGTYWSGFGEGVILALIQVGGFRHHDDGLAAGAAALRAAAAAAAAHRAGGDEEPRHRLVIASTLALLTLTEHRLRRCCSRSSPPLTPWGLHRHHRRPAHRRTPAADRPDVRRPPGPDHPRLGPRPARAHPPLRTARGATRHWLTSCTPCVGGAANASPKPTPRAAATGVSP